MMVSFLVWEEGAAPPNPRVVWLEIEELSQAEQAAFQYWYDWNHSNDPRIQFINPNGQGQCGTYQVSKGRYAKNPTLGCGRWVKDEPTARTNSYDGHPPQEGQRNQGTWLCFECASNLPGFEEAVEEFLHS